MTGDEIIHVFEHSRLVSDNFTTEAVTASYVAALAALRDQEERENPKPLTLDELRQMDGEPVWIQCEALSEALNDRRCWKVVTCASDFAIEFTDGICLPVDYYGKFWLAYRTKPKERTK